MFTGIVQAQVEVVQVESKGSMRTVSVKLGDLTRDLALGASVAVNGVCLTVTKVADEIAEFDVIAETLSVTNLGQLKEGDLVNVERSFTVGTEVGGHIVSGHVTGTAALIERRDQDHNHVVRLQGDPDWLKYVFHKGFVAVDGASLTVSSIDKNASWFEISLIPETLSRTSLGYRAEGDLFNVEVEAQTVTTVDTVERLLTDPQWVEYMRDTFAKDGS